jgi:ABC-type sugar transport system, permease component
MTSATIKKKFPLLLLEIILLLLSLIIIVPLLIMLLGSFKNELEVTNFSLALPQKWLFSNYAQVVEEGSLLTSFLNGIYITVVSTVLTIVVSSIAAFVLARKNTKFSNFLYYFFFLGIIIPMQIIPTIQLFKFFHIFGGYTNAILLYCAINIPFSCFLYTGFIKGIPRALDEAAFLEGASVLKTYYSVIFPLLKPVNMTVLILVFMGIWNDINIPLYFLSDPSKWTMPLSVYQFYGMYGGSSWNLVFADLTLTALPVLILYLFGQKYLISGLTEGAVKA